MKCLECHNNNATKDPKLGILPCRDCRKRQAALPRPRIQIEFTSDSIKQQRKVMKNSIIQPHYKGQLDKRYVDLYGADRVLRRGFSQDEIKKAKYLNIDEYYSR